MKYMLAINLFYFGILFGAIVQTQGSAEENYYKDLDCEPIKNANGKIEKYDCSILEGMEDGKCFYNGTTYSVGETINKGLTDNCLVECTCRTIYQSNLTEWSCLSIECPENFQRWGNCKFLYKHGECCASYPPHCDKEVTKELPTCEYGGQKYIYGEKFYPKEACQYCICAEGFNGTLAEPWCHPFSCNLYLHYHEFVSGGCVPLYYDKDSCCPIPTWRCPQDTDKVITTKNINSTSTEVCNFGKLNLKIGEILSPEIDGEKCVDCSCNVPPHLTCVKNQECEKIQQQ